MNRSKTSKRRVLFFAEAATLAHVVRSVVLAQALDQDRFELAIATGPDFRRHVSAAGLPVIDLWCIGTRKYLEAVLAGRPVYTFAELERYVDDDLRVIQEFQPDIIVGDFRHSLAVSARLAKIPYIGISNAHWSPQADASFDIPIHKATKLVGVGVANAVFKLIRPLIFAQHSLPMYRLCRKYRLPALGFDLRAVFTEADHTVFADVPELVPTDTVESDRRYTYIGPITWSPAAAVPQQLLDDRDDPRPLVYVGLGSSGDTSVLDAIVDALVSLDCRVAVAATGWLWRNKRSDAVHVHELLPGRELAALSKLVICNGGNGVHQALQQGTPVLGIPANLDQMLNMHFIVKAGAGLALRADQVTSQAVRERVAMLLKVGSYREKAQVVQTWFARYQTTDRFAEILSGIQVAAA